MDIGDFYNLAVAPELEPSILLVDIAVYRRI